MVQSTEKVDTEWHSPDLPSSVLGSFIVSPSMLSLAKDLFLSSILILVSHLPVATGAVRFINWYWVGIENEEEVGNSLDWGWIWILISHWDKSLHRSPLRQTNETTKLNCLKWKKVELWKYFKILGVLRRNQNSNLKHGSSIKLDPLNPYINISRVSKIKILFLNSQYWMGIDRILLGWLEERGNFQRKNSSFFNLISGREKFLSFLTKVTACTENQ